MVIVSHKLHLGAFDDVHEGWVNTDVTPHLLVARVPGLAAALHALGVVNAERYAAYRSGAFGSVRYLDVSRRFRFPDAYFQCVFASHLLEHLHPDQAEHCLRETRRVLAPGGVLRLVVPDLDQMVAAYDPADPDTFLWGIFQGRGRRSKRSARHWWHYNADSLGELLQQVGFVDIEQRGYREGRCPEVERIDNRPGSLFMEAIR